MKNLNVAVIGAGVAGLSFAILAIQKGFNVTVFEKENQISSIGAGVTLWPNACFVLDKMETLDSLKALGGLPQYVRQFDSIGNLKNKVEIGEINHISGFPTITILRKDLMHLLYSQFKALGGRVHFQKEVSSETLIDLRNEFDLVIGADGRMRSVVRDELYSDHELPRYQGFINAIGISPIANSNFQHAISEFRGNKERFGIVSVRGDLCYWAAAWRSELDRARPKISWYREMKERFSGWDSIIPTLIEKIEDDSFNRIFVHDLDPLPYWHKGNLLIIGDAAHAPLPTSGQGACQALEDAWHLTEALSEFHLLDEALEHFYQTRIEKATFAQQAGRAVANQIFSEDTGDTTSSSLPSPKQLSDMWMKDLVTL